MSYVLKMPYKYNIEIQKYLILYFLVNPFEVVKVGFLIFDLTMAFFYNGVFYDGAF